ncbi:carbohydrate ABC transporter permease [Paenibacillus oryzisoli]|uniref:ABC transporter permease n=1 Tax=Paenibacillus oryzisoli TaxID=1850517 RepID=A0A197ZX19_9BACL|nr:carbohydrate ABC transporter permease [Paenibacillus oryzisoli]OAS13273.1 ABC transporter permease [Paenibacillus oryzisoli]
MKLKNVLGSLNHLISILISLVMVVPLLLIVNNSLKESSQASSMGFDLPKSLHFENYSIVIEKGKLAHTFLNSVMYSGFSTIIGILLASMAAYVFARNKSKMNRMMYLFVIMGIAMPINYVTLTKVMQFTHLINSQAGIIILYAAFQIPFSVFLIYGFVEGVPKELDEAAVVDGCGPNRAFFQVVFPLLRPVAITAAILIFMNTWNEFVLPLYYLNDTSNWPMTLAIYNFFGQFSKNWNLVSADIVLTSLPVVIVYLFGQKYIVSGMVSGSVKG